METKEIFTEVRINYYNEEEQRWYIDAWTDPDDENNGRCVGWIDGLSGNVYYNCEEGEQSPMVQEMAKEVQNEVRQRQKDKQKQLGVTIAMLTSEIYPAIYDNMREKDCVSLCNEIRLSAIRFEKQWQEWMDNDEERDYIEEIENWAEKEIENLKGLYC